MAIERPVNIEHGHVDPLWSHYSSVARLRHGTTCRRRSRLDRVDHFLLDRALAPGGRGGLGHRAARGGGSSQERH